MPNDVNRRQMKFQFALIGISLFGMIAADSAPPSEYRNGDDYEHADCDDSVHVPMYSNRARPNPTFSIKCPRLECKEFCDIPALTLQLAGSSGTVCKWGSNADTCSLTLSGGRSCRLNGQDIAMERIKVNEDGSSKILCDGYEPYSNH